MASSGFGGRLFFDDPDLAARIKVLGHLDPAIHHTGCVDAVGQREPRPVGDLDLDCGDMTERFPEFCWGEWYPLARLTSVKAHKRAQVANTSINTEQSNKNT